VRTAPVVPRFLLGIALAVAVGGCAGSTDAPPRPTTAPGSAGGPAETVRGTAGSRDPGTALAPAGATERARVVRVVDGDTIIVDRGQGNERLRYIGIDAPESVKPDTPVEFMGREASHANESLVAGREVVLERDVSETDRFGRLLRYVWLRGDAGWTFVNLELVRRGFANAATFPPDVRWRDTFREAESAARDAGLGLWGPATPAP
jgi:endonuclease YncB( thermonuclease family)